MPATRRIGMPFRVGLLALAVLVASGATTVATNAFGMGDRFERTLDRVMTFVDPPPDRGTAITVVVTPRPSATPYVAPPGEPAFPHEGRNSPTPVPRVPVDVNVAPNPDAVFTSQITEKDCAVAGTQMVLTILGLGNPSQEFQTEIHDRIDDWESLDDSLNGNWGPGAVRLALAAYGAPDYEERAYESYTDALRDSAIAISTTGKPVVMFPWWGAHTWVMTGYKADADPSLFTDAVVSGAYILDPWYPRNSDYWGWSDEPGNFEDLAELERNWPAVGGPPGLEWVGTGWTRPEGPYPTRDGKFVVLIPTA